MVFENLALHNEGGILTITVNRPDKLNALNQRTMHELDAAFHLVANDESIKAVMITGAGEKAFVAGADISELRALPAADAARFAARGHAIFAAIENCAKPVVAAVNGFALGGGCELAMACHLRIASENARFGLPEVNLGIIPGYGGTQRLTQLVGKTKAFELIMTADMVSAAEALQLGLVNHVVPAADLLNKCKEILAKITSKGPVAIAQAIRAVNAAVAPIDGYAVEAEAFGHCCTTQDMQEGTQAFLEKRKANFKGV